MKLLTKELLKKLPPIGHSIDTKEEPQAIVNGLHQIQTGLGM